jgi:hypothetical protein
MIFEAIKELYPTAVYTKERDGVYTAQDENYDDVTLDMVVVEAKAAELQVIADYQQPRKVAYPSVTDQLDALFHAGVFPAEMAAAIQAVKDAYPKP